MKKVLKSVSICFIIAAMLTAGAFAAVPAEPDRPQASKYISGTTTAIGALGGGKIEVDFAITATKPMKDVGALQVDFYEVGSQKDTRVASYHYTNAGYGYLMDHNSSTHLASVTYNGTSGKKYYANVKFFAGERGVAGDIYTMPTIIVTA